LEVPTTGRVLFGGADVAGLDPLRLRRRVGMVFQRPTPFPSTVRDNLRVAEPSIADNAAALMLEKVGLDAGFLDRMSKEIDRRVDERVARERRPARRRSHEAELGIFVPLFIIAGIFGGFAGIAAAAAALVVVFLVSELRQ